MHCKSRQVLCVPFSSNQENGSQMTFVAGDSKIPKKFENLVMIK